MMRVRSHCQHVEWEAWKFCIFRFAVCWELQRDRHRHNKQLTCLQDGYFTLASDWAFRSLSVPLDLLLEVCLLHWVITLGAYWRVWWSWVLHMLAFLVQVTGGHSVQRKLTYQTWFLGFPNIVKSCSGRRCVQVGSDPFAQSRSMAKSSLTETRISYAGLGVNYTHLTEAALASWAVWLPHRKEKWLFILHLIKCHVFPNVQYWCWSRERQLAEVIVGSCFEWNHVFIWIKVGFMPAVEL